jgi:hypothetical protein
MLASLRLKSVRHALVIMLMILSALVVVERAQAVTNSVQHGLAIDHAAPVLELVVADHDHDDEHGRLTDDGSSATGENDPAPGPHHHHSEGPQVAALTSPVTLVIAVSRSEALFLREDTGSPQSRIFGLERPPKTLSERA